LKPIDANELMTDAHGRPNNASNCRRTPVLIAGGGPTGLALASELGWRGISCVVVEQGDGGVDFPTTNLVNTRTCEYLRRWGLADQVRYRAGFPPDYPRNYVFVTRMNGYQIARFEHPPNGDPASRSAHSPEGRLWVQTFLRPRIAAACKRAAGSRGSLWHVAGSVPARG
jgi:hypothetical protein